MALDRGTTLVIMRSCLLSIAILLSFSIVAEARPRDAGAIRGLTPRQYTSAKRAIWHEVSMLGGERMERVSRASLPTAAAQSLAAAAAKLNRSVSKHQMTMFMLRSGMVGPRTRPLRFYKASLEIPFPRTRYPATYSVIVDMHGNLYRY